MPEHRPRKVSRPQISVGPFGTLKSSQEKNVWGLSQSQRCAWAERLVLSWVFSVGLMWIWQWDKWRSHIWFNVKIKLSAKEEHAKMYISDLYEDDLEISIKVWDEILGPEKVYLKRKKKLFSLRIRVKDDIRLIFHSFLNPGRYRGQWCCWQIKHDPALLQGNLHSQLQEDYRRRLPREASQVGRKKMKKRLDGWLTGN